MAGVNYASNWNAGDGYQVTDDYLSPSGLVPALKNNYFGGGDSAQVVNANNPGSYSIANGSGSDSGSIPGSAYGNAAGGIASAYNGASTDTGSSVLSGAASGAAAGTAIMPGWGTAIGAVIGGIAGFFGSKSKKKQANQQFQQNLQLATAGEQQAQANWLQKQQLTQAAISPYAASNQPGGYQFKNNMFGGSKQGNSVPEPTAGQLNIPNAAPSITSPGLGKPLTTNMPGSSFTPSTGLAAPPTAPTYSKNPAENQMNINQYAQQLALQDYQKNQLAAAQAMNPYAQFGGQG